MPILGTALLALCYLAGLLSGEFLGRLIGVEANVGGVGFAMILLLVLRNFLRRTGHLAPGVATGITFWAAMYIPVVIAMAASQNVITAIRSGPIALLAAVGSVASCFSVIALINRGRFARSDDGWKSSARQSAGEPE